jgi:hypothetical protein
MELGEVVEKERNTGLGTGRVLEWRELFITHNLRGMRRGMATRDGFTSKASMCLASGKTSKMNISNFQPLFVVGTTVFPVSSAQGTRFFAR